MNKVTRRAAATAHIELLDGLNALWRDYSINRDDTLLDLLNGAYDVALTEYDEGQRLYYRRFDNVTYRAVCRHEERLEDSLAEDDLVSWVPVYEQRLERIVSDFKKQIDAIIKIDERITDNGLEMLF